MNDPIYYKKNRCCTNCHVKYQESTNIGTLTCRIHPGLLMYDHADDTFYYGCCGKKRGYAKGCFRMDHMNEEIHPLDTHDLMTRLRQIHEFAYHLLSVEDHDKFCIIRPLRIIASDKTRKKTTLHEEGIFREIYERNIHNYRRHSDNYNRIVMSQWDDKIGSSLFDHHEININLYQDLLEKRGGAMEISSPWVDHLEDDLTSGPTSVLNNNYTSTLTKCGDKTVSSKKNPFQIRVETVPFIIMARIDSILLDY